jgi:hypothetical protein
VTTVSLLEADRERDVRRGHGGEEQVSRRHVRREPERAQPAHVERVAHHPIRTGSDEAQRAVISPPEEQPDLAQPEQIEVIDPEGRGEDQAWTTRRRAS